MNSWRAVVAVWFFITCAVYAHPVIAASSDARQLWQLLDYVAVDYSGAVTNGTVVSAAEYAEMKDFTDNAVKQVHDLPAHASKAALVAAIGELRAAVVRKADDAEVTRLAQHANMLLLAAYPMPVAPQMLPDLARGGALYSALCASCHGVTGRADGPLAPRLEPKPIAFTDPERARSRSVMALYQVVSQGVAGTSMPSFSSLSEEDRWALAFFIGTMSHDGAMRSRGEQLWRQNVDAKSYFPDLAAVSTMTEAAAAKSMPTETAKDLIAYLRSNPGAVETDKPTGIALARLRLKESLAALRSGDKTKATKLGLSAYLDGFEPLEPIVSARDQSLMTAVETAMLSFRSAVVNGTTEQAEEAAGRLDNLFARVDAELGQTQATPMSTFFGALTILLREGVEALLIVVGIIAFLKKAGRSDVLRHVHAGWISALGAGAVTWAVATYLVTISGASREVAEGVGALFAAVVLLSVGMWMHQKSSADRWQAYINEKLTAALTRRSAWSLFALAFIAVYREVFETVLFYSALAVDGNGGALLAGFLTAIALLSVIAWALLRTSARMPIGKFFSITSVFVAVLSVVLIGKGFSALQEAGLVGANPIGIPRVDLLGIYPTAETIMAQIIMLVVALTGFGINLRNARKSTSKKTG